jgi:hypothetical protein
MALKTDPDAAVMAGEERAVVPNIIGMRNTLMRGHHSLLFKAISEFVFAPFLGKTITK